MERTKSINLPGKAPKDIVLNRDLEARNQFSTYGERRARTSKKISTESFFWKLPATKIVRRETETQTL